MTPIRQSPVRSRQATLALLMVLAATSFLWASEPDQPAIKVSVLAILANDRTKKVAPELECIADELRKVNPNLTSFRVAKMSCKSVKIGARDTFDLGNDQSTTIIIDGKDPEGCVQLRVTAPLLGEIHYLTTCGKFLPIFTRYETKTKEQLIIAVRVQPCQGKK